MSILKPVGNGAAARKYDLLTAMGTMALASAPAEQRLVLRLMVAITARYNWSSDILAVAQKDLARMWSCDERTVKRVMAEFRNRGWLILKRAATRGRVAEYGLGIEALLQASQEDWARVGSDFEARLTPVEPAPQTAPTVVQFPSATALSPRGQIWPQMLTLVERDDPTTAKAWLQGVLEDGFENGVLHLSAKGRYQANYLRMHLSMRLLAAARQVDRTIRGVEIRCDAD